MQQSPEQAEVLREVAALEQFCNEIEYGLRANDASRLNAAIDGSRRTTHALENAMHAASTGSDEAFSAEVDTRLRKIYEIRAGQIQRLEAHRDSIAERLAALSNWKQYARSIGGPKNKERKSILDERR